jgi:hypothetical protein
MSRVNPFAQKAGIVFAKPKRNAAYAKGLVFFRRWFESIPTDFVGVYEEYQTFTEAEKRRCAEDMRVFYYAHSCMEKSGDNRLKGRTRVDAMPIPKLIKSLQQLIFAFPMYGIYKNPDKGRTLPKRLPIMIFDETPVDQPINEERIRELMGDDDNLCK